MAENEDRPGVEAGHRNEGGKTKSGHQRYRIIRYAAEHGKARAQMAHQQARQQRADANAKRNPHIADGKSNENTGKPTKKYGKAKNKEIRRCRRRNDDADPLGRSRHDRFWPHHAQDIAAFDRNARREGDVLAAP